MMQAVHSPKTSATPYPITMVHTKVAACSVIAAETYALSTKKGFTDQQFPDQLYIYDPPHQVRTFFICGGMGPAAGLLAWGTTINKQPSERVVLDQRCSIPDRTAAILAGSNSEISKNVASKIGDSLTLAASFGTVANKTDVFIACNTAHHFIIDALQCVAPLMRARIRLHSLIDAATEQAQRLGGKTLLLCTTGTHQTGSYAKALKARGVATVSLSGSQHESLMSAIYNGVKKSNKQEALKHGMDALRDIFERSGFHSLIAGCTEIPILLTLLQGERLIKTDKINIINLQKK